MHSLSPALFKRLQAALLQCPQFSRGDLLRDLFKDPSLAPWRHALPESHNLKHRVHVVSHFLLQRSNVKHENALVLFLLVLSETLSPDQRSLADALVKLANEVGTELSEFEVTEPSSRYEKVAKQQPQASPDHLVAYCGLFCGNCIIREGEIHDLSQKLLARLQTPEFRKLAVGLPQLSQAFSAFQDYDRCCAMLETIVDHLQCTEVCKQGGGSTGCEIRRCCQEKGLQGCWMCEQFETCETLAWLNPVHQDAHCKNLRKLRDGGVDSFLEGEKHW